MYKKKSLGQHFLKASAYVRAVAAAGEVVSGDVVLEIGPGEGVLTRELLLRGATVIAIEKDRRLIPMLEITFTKEIAEKKLMLIERDALYDDISSYGLRDEGYKVVANIPYYITGALLQKFLSGPLQPSMLVFLVQKEVAERIARSRKESILSLSVKAYGEPQYVKTVPRGAFAPAPEVDSAILSVKNISRKNFADAAQEKKFFELVKAGFAHKRKLLARNLAPLLGKNHSHILKNAGINPNARAEDVPLAQWLALSKIEGLTLSRVAGSR